MVLTLVQSEKHFTTVYLYYCLRLPLLFSQVCMSLRPRRTTKWTSFGPRCVRFVRKRPWSGSGCRGTSGWNTASRVTWSRVPVCWSLGARTQRGPRRSSSTSSLRLAMWVARTAGLICRFALLVFRSHFCKGCSEKPNYKIFTSQRDWIDVLSVFLKGFSDLRWDFF